MKSNKSKYGLVVDYAIDGTNEGRLKKGVRIPSLNEFRKMYDSSHDTVFPGIRELKSRGIIKSNPGVGHYTVSTHVLFKHSIFLLFDEFNKFKEDIYSFFMEIVGSSATVDPYFHNYNRKMFETLVNNANHEYTTYIITSGKFTDIDPSLESLSGDVFLFDHRHLELKGKHSLVLQNFEKDIYEALVYGLSNLRKYKHIVMVQKDSKEPFKRYDGLRVFCKGHGSIYECIGEIQRREIVKQEVLMVVSDRDLINLSKQADRQQLVPGKDLGTISYNDTPLKEMLAGGTAIPSTDPKSTGCTMASPISKKTIGTIEDPRNLNIRNLL